MIPLLALLPSIFSAISTASEIFDFGKKVVETVTGQSSTASTPEELQNEITRLPEDKQAQWAQLMQQQIAKYRAETDRIDIEGGRIDANITSKLSTDAADKVAIMRQTTRPWAVRMAMYFVLLPVALALIDVGQGLIVHWLIQPIGSLLGAQGMASFEGFQAFKTVFGVDATAIVSGGDPDSAKLSLNNTVVGQIYTESVGWLTGIVVTYMGLREYGKMRGTSGDVPATPTTDIGKTLVQAGNIADQTAKIVQKIREAAKKF